jgi:small subunit ribosomal protein S3
MGQKTHPLGFRLGITQDHKSTWYANFNQYANVLKEDNTIRTYIDSISKVNSISNVKINRNGLNDQIQLNIETGKPGILVGDLGSGLENLLNKIKKILPSNRQLTINILEVEKVDLDATLLADLVAEQLEKRVAFKRAMREALQRAQKQNVKGIKIQVSGRLNGAEIARSEWVREGRVPLQTLRADIDYATKEANTIYGVLVLKSGCLEVKFYQNKD